LTNAKVQLVAGWKYELEFHLGVSDCPKRDDGKDLELCSVTGVQQCSATVWVRSWLNKKEVTAFHCDPVVASDAEQQQQEEETNAVNAAKAFFQQAKGNIDMIMNQVPNLPRMEEPKQPMLGGGDHDVGNYGAFVDFKNQFGKTYSSDEEERKRFSIFRDNMIKARKYQSQEQGSAEYGVTKFADLTEEEFRKFYLTPAWDQSESKFLKRAEIPAVAAPDAWDWRNKSAVTEVKNQGNCGSCWAFSVTGNIEGQNAIKTGKLVDLSEQELVDCDKLDEGCNGGLPSNAYQEIMRLGGLETETDYPYDARDEKCSFKKSLAKVQITGAVNISSNEDDMKVWLYKNGPISIGINAFWMQFYRRGVSWPYSWLCNPANIDHGVLIVGYGVQTYPAAADAPFWTIKNSWGPDWGEQGYVRFYRGQGVCGLNLMCSSATVN
jgi:cathepsin F